MTHLFLDTAGNTEISKENLRTVEVTRAGKPVLLINIALSEPETTMRGMNEIFYLLTLSSLDEIHPRDY